MRPTEALSFIMAASDSGMLRNHLESSSLGPGECENPPHPQTEAKHFQTETHTHTHEELCGLQVHVWVRIVHVKLNIEISLLLKHAASVPPSQNTATVVLSFMRVL